MEYCDRHDAYYDASERAFVGHACPACAFHAAPVDHAGIIFALYRVRLGRVDVLTTHAPHVDRTDPNAFRA